MKTDRAPGYHIKNVITVGPSGDVDFNTVEAAIDYVESRGGTGMAGDRNEYTILVYPGVDSSATPDASKLIDYAYAFPQVRIIPVNTPGQYDGFKMPRPQMMPPTPWVLRGPAVLALRHDDAHDCFVQDGLGSLSAGETMITYAAARGIPTSIGVITNIIGDADYMSSADLLTAFKYGNELVSHSNLHSSNPSDADTGRKAIQDAIQTLHTTSSSGTIIGSLARGFIQPGYWSGDWDIRNYEDQGLYYSDLLRQYHEWTMGYWGEAAGGGMAYGVPCRYGFAPTFKLTSSTTTAEIDAFLGMAATPGMFSVLYFHDVVASGASGDEINESVWQHLIDELATTWAGKIQCVTLSALANGILWPRGYDASGDLPELPPSGIPYGDFENLTDTIVDAYNPDLGGAGDYACGWYFDADTGDISVIAVPGSAVSHNYPNTKCLRLQQPESGTDTVRAMTRIVVQPGRSYALAFDALGAQTATWSNGTLTVNIMPLDGRTATDNTYVWIHPVISETIPNDGGNWVTYKATFGIPYYCDRVVIQFVLGATQKTEVHIDNIDLAAI